MLETVIDAKKTVWFEFNFRAKMYEVRYSCDCSFRDMGS